MMRQCVVMFAAAASLHAAQPATPPDLSALVAKAGVDGRVASWCSGEFRTRGRKGYAASVTRAHGGGRYLVFEAGQAVGELESFQGTPDLSCYTPAEARKLNASIRSSDTIGGGVVPLFTTTVVCGFVENTRAICWQYSPKTRTFVKIGEWQT
jgi:hypothetical protein